MARFLRIVSLACKSLTTSKLQRIPSILADELGIMLYLVSDILKDGSAQVW